jgi:uncharacterized protein YodC (DUF2158 family)
LTLLLVDSSIADMFLKDGNATGIYVCGWLDTSGMRKYDQERDVEKNVRML